MKKIICFISILSIFIFVGCKNIEINEVKQDDLTIQIASKLQNLDNNYNEETLKAMSVVLRNNILINNEKYEAKQEKIEEKYLLIAESTKNLVLKNDNNDIIEISFENNENYTWQKNIKKSEILEFALKNKISLANISSVEPVTENDKVIGLKIGKKFIDYKQLADEFCLQSNQITNISSNKSEIIITGKNKGFYNYFDIYKAEKLSNNNYNFKEILADFFDNLFLKNFEC